MNSEKPFEPPPKAAGMGLARLIGDGLLLISIMLMLTVAALWFLRPLWQPYVAWAYFFNTPANQTMTIVTTLLPLVAGFALRKIS